MERGGRGEAVGEAVKRQQSMEGSADLILIFLKIGEFKTIFFFDYSSYAILYTAILTERYPPKKKKIGVFNAQRRKGGGQVVGRASLSLISSLAGFVFIFF